MFYWDGGLRLAKADLAIDFRTRQPRAFISHAHSDHVARHEYALCTPATAALYRARFGNHRTREIPYRQPVQWGGLRLTLFPAGHCLGSAMLLAEDEGGSLLYTGDFRPGPSLTAAAAEFPPAEILIMESTFGDPRYLFPPREEVVSRLFALVAQALSRGQTPVVEAYPLGKSQEITRLLTDEGFAVDQHPVVAKITAVYEGLGVPVGPHGVVWGRPAAGRVLVTPPGRGARECLEGEVRIAVSGWAIDPSYRYQCRVDEALPFSDHADYRELLEAVERVGPKKVYCTHGPEGFVNRLREAGHEAYLLGRHTQGRMF